MNDIKELIFVYNSNSGIGNAAIDSLHKIFSPKTYRCRLCTLTHGSIKARKEWIAFIKRLSVPVLFLHRDQWEPTSDCMLPAVFINRDGIKELWISALELEELNLDQLMEHILNKLST